VGPLTVITGIIMGSAVSIAFGLAAVLFVFLVLSGEHPRLADEYGTLVRSMLLFTALSVVSVIGFLALLRGRRWIWPAQASIYACIALIAWYYWPRG